MTVLVCLLIIFVSSVAESQQIDYYQLWQSENFSIFPKLPIALTWSDDEDCRRDSELLVNALVNQTYWAMQMWDASTQTPYGILYGNMYHLGNFDECMLVKEPINTQMCLVALKADISAMPLSDTDPYVLDPHPEDIVWKKFKDSRIDFSKIPRDEAVVALCVPRSCSRHTLVHSLNHYLARHYGNATAGGRPRYNVSMRYDCSNDDKRPVTADEYAFWIFFGSLLMTAIIATVVDVNRDQSGKESKFMRLFMAFSLKKNIIKFAEREGEGGPLDFLYGIKFITICLVIYDHRVAIFLGATVFNYQTIEEELRHYNNLFLPHGDLLVDTFFYIGGLLSCYLLMDVLKKRTINPLMILLGRYVRIAPLYLFVVWFYASPLVRLGSGAIWDFGVANESLYCRENWWTNALFVNNYVNADTMCMIHAWYLACDFHFFICSIIIVFIIMKNKRLGLGLLFTITVISISGPAIVATIYHLKPTVIFYNDFLSKPRTDPTYLYLYVKSHTRATVYLMGIISGYYLFKYRTSTLKYGKGVSLLGNILGLGLLFAPMVYGSQYYHPGRAYDPIESGIFAAVRRVIWAFGCVVIMFTYRFGHVPLIGPLCSSRTMIVLSKLTYGMYLIHFIYQVTDYAKAKLPYHLIIFDLFAKGTNDVIISMLYALLLYLIIELPSRTLFKELIFSRREKQPEPTVQKPTTTMGYDNPLPVQVSPPSLHTIKL